MSELLRRRNARVDREALAAEALRAPRPAARSRAPRDEPLRRLCCLAPARERLALLSLLAPLLLCDRWSGEPDHALSTGVALCSTLLSRAHAAISPLVSKLLLEALESLGASQEMASATASRLAVRGQHLLIVPTRSLVDNLRSAKFSDDGRTLALRADPLDGAPALVLGYRRDLPACRAALLRAAALSRRADLDLVLSVGVIADALRLRYEAGAPGVYDHLSGLREPEDPVFAEHLGAWGALRRALEADCALLAWLRSPDLSSARNVVEPQPHLFRAALCVELRATMASMLAWLPLLVSGCAPLAALLMGQLCHRDNDGLPLAFLSSLFLFLLEAGLGYSALRALRARGHGSYGDLVGLRVLPGRACRERLLRRLGWAEAPAAQARDVSALLRVYGSGVAPVYDGGLGPEELERAVAGALGRRRGERLLDCARRLSYEELRPAAEILTTKDARNPEVWDEKQWLVEILRDGLGEARTREADYERELRQPAKQVVAHALALLEVLEGGGPEGPEGPKGPEGPEGPEGPKGPEGPEELDEQGVYGEEREERVSYALGVLASGGESEGLRETLALALRAMYNVQAITVLEQRDAPQDFGAVSPRGREVPGL